MNFSEMTLLQITAESAGEIFLNWWTFSKVDCLMHFVT